MFSHRIFDLKSNFNRLNVSVGCFDNELLTSYQVDVIDIAMKNTTLNATSTP